MNPGHVYYAIAEHRGILKLTGELRYPLGQSLNQAVNMLFASPELQGTVVDLQETDFIDSTCLGLLARVATQQPATSRDRPVIISTHADINRLLETMGFDHAFNLVLEPQTAATDSAKPVELAGATARVDRQVILDAHRILCEINEKNRELFQDVIEQLETEEGNAL
jgi:anti-anti-sigma factor